MPKYPLPNAAVTALLAALTCASVNPDRVGAQQGQPATGPAAAGSAPAYNPKNVPDPAKLTPSSGKPRKHYTFSIPNMVMAQDVPKNFPIQPYPNNVLKRTFLGTTRGANGNSATERIITKDKPDAVYSWYKNFFKGDSWAYQTPKPDQTGKISKSGPVYMIQATKDKQTASFFCATLPKDGTTEINIVWSKSNH